MTTTTSRAGNRQRLPEDALKRCPSCHTPRGNTRRGWEPITRDGAVLGYTCPTCPAWDEPIRREISGTGARQRVRFLAVVGGTPGEDGKRRQLKRRFWTLEDARDWVTETREGVEAAAAKSGHYSDPSTLTVRALCERWLEVRRKEVGTPGGIREVSVNGYASALDAPLRHMGDRVAREVTTGDVEDMLRLLVTVGGKWGRPLSHRSVGYALTALRQAFKYAVREGWLKSSPAAEAKAPRAQHTRSKDAPARRWKLDQLKAFRSEADTYGEGERFNAEPWLKVGMRLTLCGLRRSEVLGLDWENVDLGVGSVEVTASRVKTGRGTATALGEVKSENGLRVVNAEALHPGTLQALRALWLVQGRPESGLVILDAAGQPVAPDHYSVRFRALCRDAGVPALARVHNVRHSLATLFEAAKMPEHMAAALLGHDVVTYRRFYLVTDNDAAAEAAEEGGRLLA